MNTEKFITRTKDGENLLSPRKCNTSEVFLKQLNESGIDAYRDTRYSNYKIRIPSASIIVSHDVISLYITGWGIDDISVTAETTFDSSVFKTINAAIFITTTDYKLNLVFVRLYQLAMEDDTFDIGSQKDEIIGQYFKTYSAGEYT